MDRLMCIVGEIGKIVVNEWKKGYSFKYNAGILFITKKDRVVKKFCHSIFLYNLDF